MSPYHDDISNIKSINDVYVWFLSQTEMNRLQHATNGNSSASSSTPKASALARKEGKKEPPPPPKPKKKDAKQKMQDLQAELKEMQAESLRRDIKRQKETNKHLADMQATMVTFMKTMMMTVRQLQTSLEASKPKVVPRAKMFQLAATTIDVKAVDDAVPKEDWKSYLTAVGNEGRWILLQQLMNDNPAMIPTAFDVDIEVANTWTDHQIQQLDGLLPVWNVAFIPAAELKNSVNSLKKQAFQRRLKLKSVLHVWENMKNF